MIPVYIYPAIIKNGKNKQERAKKAPWKNHGNG
jgi:hypothetical protein